MNQLVTKLIRRDETRGAFSSLKACDTTFWADLDEFFIQFEHVCSISAVVEADMISQLKAKRSTAIFERFC